jgi:GTP-binding protein LepA
LEITDAKTPTTNMVKGFEDVKPMVLLEYILLTPNYEDLRNSMEKLQLNDATCILESSAALGFGFRCGFLGMLHGNHPGTFRT